MGKGTQTVQKTIVNSVRDRKDKKNESNDKQRR